MPLPVVLNNQAHGCHMAIAGFFRIVWDWPFGLLDYGSATLRCKIRSLPFLGWRPHALHPGAIQGKEGIKFCHLATLLPGPTEERRRQVPAVPGTATLCSKNVLRRQGPISIEKKIDL